ASRRAVKCDGGFRLRRRLGGLADAELAQAPAQGARVDAEDARGALLALDHPARALEDALDVAALDVFQALGTRGCGGGARKGELAVGDDERALDHVLELADVSRPVVGAGA